VIGIDLDHLQRLLGYRFRDVHRLIHALSHRSLGAENNERLEFLGDSILNFHVAEVLYRLHPTADEGQLSRTRAQLVKKDTLADVARELSLGDFLQLGAGELRSGGAYRDSILSDALEAVIAAVYLDADMDSARACVDRLMGQRIHTLSPLSQPKDPKTSLQEHLQARGLELPRYAIEEMSGKDHNREFRVRCEVSELEISETGTGHSRKAAEQAAARSVLAQLGISL